MIEEEFNENQISRTYDRIAEKSIISSILQESKRISEIEGIVLPDDFSVAVYKELYDAMLKMHDNKVEINIVTVRDYLVSTGAKGNIIDLSFLKELAIYVPDPSQVESYAKIVKEKHIFRKIIEECAKINKACISGEKNVDEILDMAQGNFFNLMTERGLNEYVPFDEILLQVVDKVREASKSKDGITGIRTDIKQLDRMLSGLQNSNLIIIGARPGVGKTAFALNLVYRAMKNGVKPAFFSLEMSSREIAVRLLEMESKISGTKFRNGQFTSDEWGRFYDSLESINKNVIIDDTPGLSIGQLRSKARKYKTEGTDIIFIDYLQLMNASKSDEEGYKRQENRQQEVALVSRNLKELAKELDIPVVALAQTRRSDPSEKKDKRPKLEDLKESGSIEQDADIVLFLHRVNIDGAESGDPNEMQIIIAKHRNGETGNIKLTFDTDTLLFYESEKPNSTLIDGS